MRDDTVDISPALTVTRSKMAAICGVAQRNVTRWRTAGRIPRNRAAAIAAHLGMEPHDLFPDWYAGVNDLPDVLLDPSPLVREYGSLLAVATALRTDVHFAQVWRDGIPLDVADKAAIARGLHPSNLWPEWLDEIGEP